jgi:polyphenol oxidase
MSWLETLRLGQFPWLIHAFSMRQGGVSTPPCAGLNLGFTGSDRRERVEENRRRFFRALGAKDFSIPSLRQIHSSHCFIVSGGNASQPNFEFPGGGALAANPPAGDGLITCDPGILLTIRIADCMPILLVDTRRRAVAAVHAGWRGAWARIIEKSVGDLRRAFSSDPGKLLAAVGPSIRACCYEVGQEVVEAFHGKFANSDSFFLPLRTRPEAATDRHSILFLSAYPPGHAPDHLPAARLDLVAVARHQLQSAGLKASNILIADYCTACRTDLLFSHRREGPATGRQVAAIGILDPRKRRA